MLNQIDKIFSFNEFTHLRLFCNQIQLKRAILEIYRKHKTMVMN